MKKRWLTAQQSEKNFWEESFADEPAFRKMCLSFYPLYNNILERNNIDTNDMNVLDIGSGPYGFVSVIDAKRKVAIDPLMNYFVTKVPEEFYLKNNLNLVDGVGENLDIMPSKSFDLVCCLNTLDHAEDPRKVMSEANRVLKSDGYLLLSVNHYAWPIALYRWLLEMYGLGDRNHPNTYHLNDITNLIYKYNFKVIDQKLGEVNESKKIISEVGGTTAISFKERMHRALKTKGLWYVIKQAIVTPGHLILNKLFTTYPDSIFLCKKEVAIVVELPAH